MTRKRDARDPVLVAIGREFRKIVKAAGKRQIDVAMETGIGLRTIAGYMAGGDIPLSALLRIAPVVGMEPEALTARLTAAGMDGRKEPSQRNCRGRPSEGQLELPARQGDGAGADLSPSVLEALAKQEAGEWLRLHRVQPPAETKPRRRGPS